MKMNIKTSKIVYYYQHVNARGFCEIKAKIELPGLGQTVDECFKAWKQFMAAAGYGNILDGYELEYKGDRDNDCKG